MWGVRGYTKPSFVGKRVEKKDTKTKDKRKKKKKGYVSTYQL